MAAVVLFLLLSFSLTGHAYDNVALRKPAFEQHIYTHVNVSAGNAVDGLKTNLSGLGGQCSLSANEKYSSTWWVNLTNIASIHHITIYYRTDNQPWTPKNGYTPRFLGFSIFLSNSTERSDWKPCFRDNGYFTRSTIPSVFNTTCPMHAQYIIYHNERLPGKEYPTEYSKYAFNDLCEVEVYGCPAGYHGFDCSKQCPEDCPSCNVETGNCTQPCPPGYNGPHCDEECAGRKFGPGCQMSCGHCVNLTQCDHVNGSCLQGCDRGYKGDYCTNECDGRKFGLGCHMSCGHCVNLTPCDHVNGSCLEGCDPGYMGDKCTKECSHSTYGRNCKEKCSAKCRKGRCDAVSGNCIKGCKKGWKGSHCNTACDGGFFGMNCLSKCGHCLNKSPCHHVNGACSKGCDTGYKGQQCKRECNNFRYGQDCKKPCGHCNNREQCHHINGTCPSGCSAGYTGSDCNKTCDVGSFGMNCLSKCGHCLNKSPCHHVNGSCSEGCDPGYKGQQCKRECNDLRYGQNCNKECGHCNNSKQCHHINGTCLNGCSDGYNGHDCNEKCNDMKYGQGCKKQCGNCIKGEQCHHINGTCLKGCSAGYNGSYCNHTCVGHFFGENCKTACGNCVHNEKCDSINGTCPNGCRKGFRDSLCNKECERGSYGWNCSKRCSVNCRNSSQCDAISGNCKEGCLDGWKGYRCLNECDSNMFGENCSRVCGNCVNSTQCHHINGTCLAGCHLGYKGIQCFDECEDGRFGYDCRNNCSSLCINSTCHKETGHCEKIAIKQLTSKDTLANSSVAGIIVGMLVIAVIAVLIVVVFRRYKVQKRTNERTEMIPKGSGDILASSEFRSCRANAETPLVDTEMMNGDPEYCNINNLETTNIPIDKLDAVIAAKKLNENEGFRKEYSAFPTGEVHKCDIGKKTENGPKNRYKTTFPYDHSRVILNTQNGDKSDYINANYIEGPHHSKQYIASQGPKPNTFGDFWRMIWQENVTIIVMVTNLMESEKIKCAQYWPDMKKKISFGPISVELITEKHCLFYTTRQLSVFHEEAKKSRVIWHHHYTAWPDHGTPEPLCLVVFHSHVISTSTNEIKAPTVVHCSAGVGRTGTYIALDALHSIGRETGKVDVFKFVRKMRDNRMSMVQTCDQYITIFLALNEIFKAPIKMNSVTDFCLKEEQSRKNTAVNLSPSRQEFQLLLKVRPVYSKDEDYKLAKLAMNKDKGLDDILPLDKYVLHLTSVVPNRGNYVNAITIPSFLTATRFIVTKFPSPEDSIDLLRLLCDHDSDTVICMQPLQDTESSHAWFPGLSSSVSVPPFTVKHESKSQTDVTTHVINVHRNNQAANEARTIMIVEPSANIIASGSCLNTSHLRSLVSTVLQLQSDRPVTIVSSDGASLCGVFIAVHNAIEQLNTEGGVDVFTTLRMLQLRRPEFCERLEEYQLVYGAVYDHIQGTSENIYCNQ